MRDTREETGSTVPSPADETAGTIARELVTTDRRNVTVTRTLRANVRAQLCVRVRRVLRR